MPLLILTPVCFSMSNSGQHGREVLDENAVAMVAEGVEELLALRLGDEFAGNLDDDLAAALVGVEPFDVVDERLEVELEAGEFRVGFLGHAVDRDVDLVDAGFDHRADALRRQERAVGGGVDIVDVLRTSWHRRPCRRAAC